MSAPQKMSRLARADKVLAAAEELAAAAAHAHNAELVLDDAEGTHAEELLAIWENVERLGAICHRQARLLAGKTKGG